MILILKKRARKRCQSEEFFYEYLIERRYRRIEKKIREGVVRFELQYDHKDKSKKEKYIIVIIPLNTLEKKYKGCNINY